MNVPLSQQNWIISRRWDLVLFLGLPLICVAAILPLRAWLPSDRIALFLLALFATGHHLPGFLRIYGDPTLFRRFQARFLLMPPLVFGAALWFADRNLHGLILITALWDLWHSLMQHYGFMRIYAAKNGETSPTLSRLDLWLSLCWFATIALLSPLYSLSLMRGVVQTFGAQPTPRLLAVLRWAAVAVTLAVTAMYVVTTVRARRAGARVSGAKLALLVGTVSFIALVWWLLNDLVLGYAIWAVFHDVQYFAIVWIYGRGLTSREAGARPFLGFLFRQKLPLVFLYLAMIFAYGSLSLVQDGMSGHAWRTALGAFIATSTLLHYYFDGFIWKVRERGTREALSVADAVGSSTAGATTAITARPRRRERFAVQLAAIAIPIAICLWAEPTARSGEHTYRALTSIYPGWGDVQFRLGDELLSQNELLEAAQAYHAGLALQPDAPHVHQNLAILYVELGQLDCARHHLERAAALAPHDPEIAARLETLQGQRPSDRCCSAATAKPSP
jgi:hypothetical protein